MPYLLDTTLRDGSNVVNFQFSLEHISQIAAALEKSKVDFLEVSHGYGVGFSEKFPHFKSAHSDYDYVLAAKTATHGNIKIGVLTDSDCTTPERMKPLWDMIDFVRIGVDLKNPQTVLPMLAEGKRHGKKVFLQLVRSSMLKDKTELLPLAQAFRDGGADVIYVVDTGGLMLPKEAFETVVLLRERTGLPIGFHGHNHLQLAMANTLAALRAGADYVDGCLHTMGKGPGNAQTEILAHLLNSEYGTSYRTETLIEAAESVVFPLIKEKTVAGSEGYHLRCAFSHMDFDALLMKTICEQTQASEAEVRREFLSLPDYFAPTVDNVRLVMNRLATRPKSLA